MGCGQAKIPTSESYFKSKPVLTGLNQLKKVFSNEKWAKTPKNPMSSNKFSELWSCGVKWGQILNGSMQNIFPWIQKGDFSAEIGLKDIVVILTMSKFGPFSFKDDIVIFIFT